MAREVPLPGGLFALIDENDAAAVLRYRWHVMRRGHTHYAKYTLPWTPDGRRPALLMHRLILGATNDDLVDHRDGNGLNNQRSNLRVCTAAENLRNARTRVDNASGLKGVGFDRRANRYHARIFLNGRTKHLGYFASAEEAHAAYCRAASDAFGDFARFN